MGPLPGHKTVSKWRLQLQDSILPSTFTKIWHCCSHLILFGMLSPVASHARLPPHSSLSSLPVLVNVLFGRKHDSASRIPSLPFHLRKLSDLITQDQRFPQTVWSGPCTLQALIFTLHADKLGTNYLTDQEGLYMKPCCQYSCLVLPADRLTTPYCRMDTCACS